MPTCANCTREADFSYEVSIENVLHFCNEHLPNFARKAVDKLVDLADVKARKAFDEQLSAQQAEEAGKSKKKPAADAADAPADASVGEAPVTPEVSV